MTTDVVVFGGGAAGLAAGRTLRGAGVAMLLLETHARATSSEDAGTVAGAIQTDYRADGEILTSG